MEVFYPQPVDDVVVIAVAYVGVDAEECTADALAHGRRELLVEVLVHILRDNLALDAVEERRRLGDALGERAPDVVRVKSITLRLPITTGDTQVLYVRRAA